MKAKQIADGLRNVVAKLNTENSKIASSYYEASNLSPVEVTNAYRTSWLARKVVDIPARDSVRRWRQWNASTDQITAIEAEERRLAVRQKVLRARILARLKGGAGILIGTGTSNPELPLSLKEIGKGGLRYLTVLGKDQLGQGPAETNVESAYYNRPSYYSLPNGVQVHPSRIALFIGASLPEDDPNTQQGWGDSVLTHMMDALKQADSVTAGVVELVFEAKQDIIKIPNFMRNLMDNGYEDKIQKRFSLARLLKGNNSLMLLDREEEYDQKTMNFSNLGDLMDRFYQSIAGASDIPVTRLFGRSAAGMNSTGDGDLKNYYDHIQSIQELEIDPSCHWLNEALIQSALGSRDPAIFCQWNSLWQTSEKERAEVGKSTAETIKVLSESGLFPEETLSHAAATSMIETGALPGLEAAINEFGMELEDEELPVDETTPLDPAENEAMPKKVVLDAEPRTLYIHRKVLNGAEILAWAKGQGFVDPLKASDLHVTLAYSRTPVDWMKVSEPWEDRLELPEGGPRLMETLGEGARVLLFNSSSLKWRHESIHGEESGAVWDFPDYQPHITISYEDIDLSLVKPYTGRIILGPEIYEEVNENWREENT